VHPREAPFEAEKRPIGRGEDVDERHDAHVVAARTRAT
jgi:hypothetical protein